MTGSDRGCPSERISARKWRQSGAKPVFSVNTRPIGRKPYKDFPHGMPTTQADTINADLLAFLQS